jgi:hypothetical protein
MNLSTLKTERSEWAYSKKAGCTQTWYVQPHYEIRDQVLVHKIESPSEIGASYPPIAHPTLASELAKITIADEGAIVKFASRYGHLGYAQLKPEENLEGDPLPWVWAHVRTLQICFELIWLTEHGSKKQIYEYLRGMQPPGTASSEFIAPKQTIACRDTVQSVQWGKFKPGGREAAIDVLVDILNRNAGGITQTLVATEKCPRRYYRFSALIEMAYWHLSNAFLEDNVARCHAKGCGAYFIQTDQRQKFCPSYFDPRSERRYIESACAIRERVKRSRRQSKERTEIG